LNYYTMSGIWDVTDKAEVRIPDERFHPAGTESFRNAAIAMSRSEAMRIVRMMQTIEKIRQWQDDGYNR
jgi:hypothetical protein